jgi:hypothetical protein
LFFDENALYLIKLKFSTNEIVTKHIIIVIKKNTFIITSILAAAKERKKEKNHTLPV